MSKEPLIKTLLANPLSGEAIERRSFEMIDQLLTERPMTGKGWDLLRRLVHASGDASLVNALRISDGAIEAGIAALQRGAPLVVDSQMIRAGLSLARLRGVWPGYQDADITCHIADQDVAEQALESGLPRSLHALQKARSRLDGAIVAFGNSPVALLELNRLIIEQGVRPAVVIGFPVGFVHVEEAKQELLNLDVSRMILNGNRGGSPLAVAAIHALCGLAEQSPRRDIKNSASISSTPDIGAQSTAIQNGKDKRREPAGSISRINPPDAIILLGHGSRVPHAGDSIVRVAEQLRSKFAATTVEACYMSRLGPHFPETFEKVVTSGARHIVVIPYFLFTGLHIQLDIPEMLQQCASPYPGVRVVYGEPLGFHPNLVEIVEQRVAEASALEDVRQIALPPRERFPVPPGQDEFVSMPPELAARWRDQFEHGSDK